MTVEIPIGERVWFCRDARCLSQVVVAGLAGIAPGYPGQIERGRTPTISLLHRLAKIRNVLTSVLLGVSVRLRRNT